MERRTFSLDEEKRLIQLIQENDIEGFSAAIQTPDCLEKEMAGLGTLVHMVTEAGRPSFLRLLLSKGAEVDRLNENGSTALQIAAYLGNEECLKLLLDHGADPNLGGDEGHSALQFSKALRRNGVAEILEGYRPDRASRNASTERS